MTERSYFWGGTVTGDASLAPYDDDEYTDIQNLLNCYDRTIQGVISTALAAYAAHLNVTCPAGATMRVGNGAALVDGKVYENTANVDFTSSGNTVYWIVGLRKTFAGQTVRAFARGTYASAALALASLVQTDGTTWEIPLATVLTDAAGNVSVITDQRKFVQPTTVAKTVNIEDSAVTLPKLEASLRFSRIETITVGAGGGTIDFLNIPQTYKHLKLVGLLRSSASGGGLVNSAMRMTFNADAGANYDYAWYSVKISAPAGLAYNHAIAAAYLSMGLTVPDDNDANLFAPQEILIPNYVAAIRHSVTSRSTNISSGGGSSIGTAFDYGTWHGLAAITRITCVDAVTPFTFVEGSVLTLYGLP